MSLLQGGLGTSQNRNGFLACVYCATQPAHQGHAGVGCVDGRGLGPTSAYWTEIAWLHRSAQGGWPGM